MKRILTLMVLGVIVAISTVAKASELAPYVTSIDLYGSSNDWSEPIGRFEKDGDGVWHLDDVEIYDVTTFKLKLHINNPQGQESDVWFGIKNGDDQTLKSASPGTIVECSSASNAPNFRIGHPGKFSFTLNDNDINSARFHFEGKFEENRFITGEFNNWGETRFTAWIGEYTLKIDPDDSPPMSGQFLIIDQDYNYLGGITNGEYYTITEDNPNVKLATEAQDKKNLYLANDGYYSFTIDGNDMLTIENWPEEVVTASIIGSTDQGWDISNARTIPLTLDQSTGYYVSEPTGIPAGFNCQLLKHSSFTSVGDTWYGGSSGNGSMEIPEGGADITLLSRLGDDLCFTDNGIFTFTLSSDFSTLNINGSYNVEAQYFLVGDFNNWNQDEKVAFVAQDGVSTLTQEMAGEFLVLDNFGNLLGGATNDNRYMLHEDWPSVTLTTDNKKNLYVANEGEYMLTIQNGVLSVSGWPEEIISAWLLGATDEDWQGNELNFKLTLDPNTGNYILGETDIPAGYRFQVVKRSSLSSVDDVWYGSYANDMYWVTEQTLGDITLTSNNNKNMYFDVGGMCTFTVSSDFSKINIQGEISPDLKPTYFLIGEFNDWDDEYMVPFVKRDGAFKLEQSFCGDFLIKDRYGNWIGTCTDGDRYIFTSTGNSALLTSANEKKNLRLELPAQYTLTIQDETLTVTGFPTDGYYMCGDFNNWEPEPMTKNADGSYSIVMTIGEDNQFKFRDHQGNWYGGNTQGNGDTYLIHSEWCTDVPLTEGDSGSNFIINTTGSYKFILAGNDDALKLTVVGFGDITLAEALEGISGNISDYLYVAAVYQNKVYVTNGTDWLRIEGVFNADELSEGYRVDLTNTNTDGFSYKGTQPTISINDFLTYDSDDLQVPVIVNYSLAEPFEPMPKPCQVVNLEGWFFDQDGMSVLCAYNDQSGNYNPSIELYNTDGMVEGRMYNIKAAITLKEPWQDIAPGIKPSDSNAIDNLTAEVIEYETKELPIATGIVNTTDAATVVSVKYVNTAGQVSLKPFKGVNIVVTTHSDGNITTVKEVH